MKMGGGRTKSPKNLLFLIFRSPIVITKTYNDRKQ